MRKVLVAVLGVVLLTATPGCGGGARPSADALSQAIQKQAGKATDAFVQHAVTNRSAQCMGRVLRDSKLSDEALRAIIDGKKYDASSSDKHVMKTIAPKFINCISALRQLKRQLAGLTPSP